MSASGFFATLLGTGLGVSLIGVMLTVSLVMVRRWDLAPVGQSLTRLRLAVHRVSAPPRDAEVTTPLPDPTPPVQFTSTVRLDPPVLRLVAETGRVVPVQGSAVLGRDTEATLTVTNERVSRRHAHLARVGGRWVVADLGSTNGTFLNGRKVGAGRDATALRDGDVLCLGHGGPAFEVRLTGMAAATARL